MINLDKSEITFSAGCRKILQSDLAARLGARKRNWVKVPHRDRVIDQEPWTKLWIGAWKINVDAAFDAEKGIGIGIVLRDWEGRLLVTRCRWIQSFFEVEIAEELACQEGLVLAREMGDERVILETDCQAIHLSYRG
ncbi:hypothetical protein C2S51_019251 [Perilla frutescens var. frutescens]|nr:hypothetical protein C2S51_019251 [Perilla frutescens var. frutescens]